MLTQFDDYWIRLEDSWLEIVFFCRGGFLNDIHLHQVCATEKTIYECMYTDNGFWYFSKIDCIFSSFYCVLFKNSIFSSYQKQCSSYWMLNSTCIRIQKAYYIVKRQTERKCHGLEKTNQQSTAVVPKLKLFPNLLSVALPTNENV